jgi:hypothetical protein
LIFYGSSLIVFTNLGGIVFSFALPALSLPNGFQRFHVCASFLPPNYTFFIPNSQIPIFYFLGLRPLPPSFFVSKIRVWGFGICLEFGIWNLEFWNPFSPCFLLGRSDRRADENGPYKLVAIQTVECRADREKTPLFSPNLSKILSNRCKSMKISANL